MYLCCTGQQVRGLRGAAAGKGDASTREFDGLEEGRDAVLWGVRDGCWGTRRWAKPAGSTTLVRLVDSQEGRGGIVNRVGGGKHDIRQGGTEIVEVEVVTPHKAMLIMWSGDMKWPPRGKNLNNRFTTNGIKVAVRLQYRRPHWGLRPRSRHRRG
jgi:hypothetical protein